MKNIKWSNVSGKYIANGSSLIKPLPNLTNAKVKKLFGKLPEGTKEKYSEAIVLINNIETPIDGNKIFPDNNPKGIYTLYTCHGEWRIGGYKENALTDELVSFLCS
jgi:hypothetical protein